MTEIKHILCPIDFSDASAHAIEQAVAIARWRGARIAALHVYAQMFMPVPGLPAPDDRVPDEEIQRISDQMAGCFRQANTAGVAVDFFVDTGRPASGILERARTLSADLIVIGTHGSGGFEHLVLGSVAENVLRKATCAVLTVPPRSHASSALPFGRLLCAVDFSEWSLKAFAFAQALAEESSAQLTALSVIEWPWEEPPPPVFAELPPEQARALSEYRRYLETSARSRLEGLVCGPARVVPRVCHGKPYARILDVANEERSDLIVMGVHSRSMLDLTLFGSTTNQVVRRARCPVLTLRK